MSFRVETGDALAILRELPDGWAQTCVTSPPCWGLRDYGVKTSVWGGSERCRHRWGSEQRGRRSDLRPSCETRARARLGVDGRQGTAALQGGCFCSRCGAWRGDLGLEPTPELYVCHLVEVFAEVRRVLRADGTLWLNLGDSYAAARSYQVRDTRGSAPVPSGASALPAGLKPKDLIGVPWRLAFALQADGWWLRADTVWCKPNPMPESVCDRPTRAHEYVFLLSKSPRYFYDSHAVREAASGRNSGNGYLRSERLSYRTRRGCRGQQECWRGGRRRNRRSWWVIPARGYRGAQAVFPEALVEPCVLAGSAPRACGICGAPYARHGGAGVRQWRPACSHRDGSGRCLVIDPFCGSGTTGVVAQRHGREFLGIELSPKTAALARRRLAAAAEGER